MNHEQEDKEDRQGRPKENHSTHAEACVRMFFTWRVANGAAKFKNTVSHLATHARTQPRKLLSPVASKAMSKIKAPVITEPVRSVRSYWTDPSRSEETNNKTGGKGNQLILIELVKEDWDHDLDIKD